MFQNLIAWVDPPPDPPEQAVSATAVATPPAIPRKPRLEKEDPVDCDAMTVSFPAAVATGSGHDSSLDACVAVLMKRFRAATALVSIGYRMMSTDHSRTKRAPWT